MDLRSPSADGGDPGLFTYPQIVHLTTVEFARARRYGYPLACVVVRVDGLESLRDVHGFRVRDLVRERVVSLVRRESRACDFLGRFPDDRLIVLLPHTDLEGARIVGERLRRGAAALVFDVGGGSFRPTLSIGLSAYRDRNTLFYDALVFAAEEAEREARARGGDRVVAREPGGARRG